MWARIKRDLDRLSCPHCPQGPGLELALRLELEAESEMVFASCKRCNRLYEVTRGGELRLDGPARRALRCLEVRCPRCHAVGYAVTYALPAEQAESHVVLTCCDCGHTFCPAAADRATAPEPQAGAARSEIPA